MSIPTIPDHDHEWVQYAYEEPDIGLRGTRAGCRRCDVERVYLPGSLRNKVLAKAKKQRKRERRGK